MQKEERMNYTPTDVHWSEVPRQKCKSGRDKRYQIHSEQQFKIEFECEFLGSIDTLIAPSKLKSLVYDNPIQQNAGLVCLLSTRKKS